MKKFIPLDWDLTWRRVRSKAWESPPAWQQEMFLISQEMFKEKQDIKNEAREISKISIKVTNITIRA
jgi:hypothetical protein